MFGSIGESRGSRIGWAGLALVSSLVIAGCSATTGQATASPPSSTPAAAAPASPPAAAASTAAGAASSASASAVIGMTSANGLGPFLTGAGGRTLYEFTADGPNTSTCSGSCAGIWPPFTVTVGTVPTAGSGVTGKLGTLTRAGGSTQVTYDGHPLYYYSGDTAAGQTHGQGILGKWFVALASGAAGAGSSSAPASSAPSNSYSNGY